MVTSRSNQGFSILEVLITAAIIGIITAVLVVRYGAFNNAVLLKGQAYEIALDLREAQTYAVSVRGEAGVYRQDYGLYFDTSTPDRYIRFLDSTNMLEYGINAAYYDVGEEVGLPERLDQRFKIETVCVNNCSTWVEDLSISFKRPDFDAQFSSRDGRDQGVGLINDATIVIGSALQVSNEIVQVVEVNSGGNISVQRSTLASSTEYGGTPNLGCTDPVALNYDPSAVQDDGSCTYASEPSSIVMQAENGSYCTPHPYSGDGIGNNHSGYTGTGFADYYGSSGLWCTVSGISGNAQVTIRYANLLTSGESLDVVVNDVIQASMSVPPTYSWSSWTERSANITLTGTNDVIKLPTDGSAGFINIDKVTITNL